MERDRSPRIIAALGTLLVCVGVFVLLFFSYLPINAKEDVEKKRGDVVYIEEEFFDVFEPVESSTIGEEEAASYLEETVVQESQAAAPSGTDVEDLGDKGDPAPVVTAKEPSEVKAKPEPQKPKAQPKEDKKKLEEEKVKREATDEVANAFKNSSGKSNASTSPDADKGNSGNKTMNRNSQGTTGTGSGSVGGGWIIPKYAPVRSTVTGSVKMVVKIDNTGKVISVSFNGGEPPAATDKSVQAAIEREIRAHKFSRANYDGAEAATAYVTYTFK